MLPDFGKKKRSKFVLEIIMWLSYQISWKHRSTESEMQHLNSVSKWKLLLNNCYKTVSGHLFAICIFIFHKTEVQTVILNCLIGLNLNLFKSYNTKCKCFYFWLTKDGLNCDNRSEFLKNIKPIIITNLANTWFHFQWQLPN